jgi:hypothetical protein
VWVGFLAGRRRFDGSKREKKQTSSSLLTSSIKWYWKRNLSSSLERQTCVARAGSVMTMACRFWFFFLGERLVERARARESERGETRRGSARKGKEREEKTRKRKKTAETFSTHVELHHAKLEHGPELVGPARDDPVEVLLQELGEDADQACVGNESDWIWRKVEFLFFAPRSRSGVFGASSRLRGPQRPSRLRLPHPSLNSSSYRIRAREAWPGPWSGGRRRSIPCVLVWLRREREKRGSR